MVQSVLVFLAAFGSMVGTALGAGRYQTDAKVDLASGGSMAGHKEAVVMRSEQRSKVLVRKNRDSRGDPQGDQEEFEKRAEAEQTSSTTLNPEISCGAHMAARCRLCTVIDPQTGAEIADQGPEWCHGHCTYYDGECHSMNAYNMKRRDAYTLDATTTRSIPDLLNPDITEEDKKIMEIAARRGLEESNYESEQKLSNEHEKREKKRDTTNKFIYYAIMGCSGCLACCACFAVVVCILGMQRKKKGASLTSNDDVQEERKKDDEGQAVEDDGEG